MQQTKDRAVAALSWSPLFAGMCAALFLLIPNGGWGIVAPPTRTPTTLASYSQAPSVHVTRLPPGVATRAIDDLHVGDRVFASNPEISDEERASWTEPDWTNWCRIQLQMSMSDGGILHIDMIRPAEWLVEENAEPGALIYLEMSEMGAEGLARVVSVSACPPIQSGRGQVITATFSHPPSTMVLNVLIEGESQSMGVTDNHLFWSVDRQRFLPIGEMALGEHVQTYRGDTKRIVSKLARPGPQFVYNIEVYGEHVYFVGESGLLAHNAYETKALREKYAGEGGLDRQNGVLYVGSKARARMLVTVEDGLFKDRRGNLIDTTHGTHTLGGKTVQTGKAIFVMDEGGNIYMYAHTEQQKFHHSSFLSGRPVAAAGEIIVKEGRIVKANLGSGHYFPEAKHHDQFKFELIKRGVDHRLLREAIIYQRHF